MTLIEPYASSPPAHLSGILKGVIQQGKIAAVPTETFYGLATNPFDRHAIERLLSVKGRGEDKAILVLIADHAQLSLLVSQISPSAQLLMDAFWPGPLTLLFAARPALPEALTAHTGAIGVRLSPCAPLIALLSDVGPVTGTSANRTGCAPARSAAEVQASLGGDIDLIVDAGTTPGGLPSTVVDARSAVRLVREGPVSRQMLENVLQTHGFTLL
jgi:L-threonylcarbamoyladenylate synthase